MSIYLFSLFWRIQVIFVWNCAFMRNADHFSFFRGDPVSTSEVNFGNSITELVLHQWCRIGKRHKYLSLKNPFLQTFAKKGPRKWGTCDCPNKWFISINWASFLSSTHDLLLPSSVSKYNSAVAFLRFLLALIKFALKIWAYHFT